MAWNNHACVTGIVWDAPKIKELRSGMVCAEFSIGVENTMGKHPDGKPLKKISWLRIKCWGNDAIDARDNLAKGDTAIITGRIVVRQFEKDGQKRSVFEVWSDFKGLKWEKKDGSKGECSDAKREKTDAEEINLDDDPF
jgi:single-strand DNA-binding protein